MGDRAADCETSATAAPYPVQKPGTIAGSFPPPPASIVARLQPALNAALWQNSVPVLSEMSVLGTSDTPFGDIEIELSSIPPVIRPRTWRIAGFGPNQVRIIEDLDVGLDGPLLVGLTEATRGSVSLVARSGPDVLAEVSQDIRILAHNEWGGTAVTDLCG